MVFGRGGPPVERSQGLFIAIMVIAIIGLVLFFFLPWVTVDKEFKDEQRFTCNDCGYSSEDEWDFEGYDSEYECPECGSTDIEVKDLSGSKQFNFNFDLKLISGDEDEWGGDELYPQEYSVGKLETFTKDTIWLSFWGLLFVMIVSILYIALERYWPIYYIFQRYRQLIIVIFCMVLLLLSLIIMTSGLRLLNLEVLQIHERIKAEQLGYEVTQIQYHIMGYLMLIFGAIILGASFVTLRNNINRLEQRYRPQRRGLSGRPIKKMIFFLLFFTILSLIFIPLLPYFGFSRESEKYSDNWEEENGEKVRVIEFSYGNPFFIEVVGSTGYASYSHIKDDLWGISALSWLSLIFLVIGVIGLAIYSMNRWRWVYISLFLTAAIALLVLSALLMAYNGFMIKDIFEFVNDLRKSGTDAELFFGYNYVPLIMAILMLIFSILFLIFVVGNSKIIILEHMRRMGPYHSGPQYYPIPPPPPSITPPPPQHYEPRVERAPYDYVQEPRRRPYTEYIPPRHPTYTPKRATGYSLSMVESTKSQDRYTSSTDYSEYRAPAEYTERKWEPRCSICGTPMESTYYGNYCPRCGRYADNQYY